MATLKIFLLGGLRLLHDDIPLPSFPTHKAACLFAYLMTFRQRAHSRYVLVGTFWGDLPDTQARRNLSTTLWRLRRTLGPGYLLTDEDTVAFNTESDYWVDVAAFEEQVDKYTSKQGDLSTCLPELREAVNLYEGDFLEGFYDDWCLLERERLRVLYLEALQALVAAYKARGDYQAALRHALLLTAHDPLREEAHREVMRLYFLLGQRHAALQQYHRCRQLLQDELGEEPLPEITALYHEIQHWAVVRPPPRLPAPSPLHALDHLPMVGREKERAELLAHVEAAMRGQGGMVLVEGEAGVGKTRLMQEVARGAEWRGTQVLWGRCPEATLASPYAPLTEALGHGLSKQPGGRRPRWHGLQPPPPGSGPPFPGGSRRRPL